MADAQDSYEQGDDDHADTSLPTATPREGAESSVLDDSAQDDGATTSGSHPLAWLVAIACALGVAALAPLIRNASGIEPFGNSYLPTLPLILLAAFAMIWNPIVTRLGGLSILAMRGRNLLLVGALTYVVAGVAMSGMATGWIGSAFSADTFHRDRNLNPALTNQVDPIRDVYGTFMGGNSRSLAVTPEGVAREQGDEASVALVSGLRNPGNASLDTFFAPLPDGQGGVASPFSVAQSALMSSLPLIIFGILLMFAIVAVTARQWTHNERLQHPLVQIPVALAEGSMLRHRGFQMTLIAMLLFWLYQIGASYAVHPLPAIRTAPLVNMPDFYKLFGMDAPGGWPKQIMTNFWGSISIYPFAIGVAFLLAIDVGFSVWGGFFFGVIVVGWLYSLGINVDFSTHGRLAGGGATMAMALVILWLGRLHYWRLLKAACWFKDQAKDPLGVLGLRVLVLSSVALVILLHFYFDAFWPAVLAILLMISFLLVIARVIAESGLACFQAAHTMGSVSVGLGLPVLLPLNGMLAMMWIASVMVEDTRNNLAGYAVQGAAMAERAKQPPRLLFTVAAVVVIAAALIAVTIHLMVGWTTTGAGMRNQFMVMDQAVRQVTNPSRDIFLGLNLEQRSIMAGVLLVFGVVLLRRFWYACPLHPIGLVVATSYPIFLVWGSLMIGWMAKIIVLRYGGSHLYKHLKPVAIALILGDVLGFGLQMVVQLSAGGVAPWRAWP